MMTVVFITFGIIKQTTNGPCLMVYDVEGVPVYVIPSDKLW
jgi:hypothetical protein